MKVTATTNSKREEYPRLIELKSHPGHIAIAHSSTSAILLVNSRSESVADVGNRFSPMMSEWAPYFGTVTFSND